jgi:hypothetical protein
MVELLLTNFLQTLKVTSIGIAVVVLLDDDGIMSDLPGLWVKAFYYPRKLLPYFGVKNIDWNLFYGSCGVFEIWGGGVDKWMVSW